MRSGRASRRHAVDPEGRVFDFRTEFQRDRDRIIHSKSFRRLRYKTQVFLNGTGDHLRTRLTHTIEVAAIARGIASGPDEDFEKVYELLLGALRAAREALVRAKMPGSVLEVRAEEGETQTDALNAPKRLVLQVSDAHGKGLDVADMQLVSARERQFERGFA